MNFDARVLSLSELDEVLAFEAELLEKSSLSEVERITAGWDAKWRREALEFYIPLGWSFAVRESGKIVGYFLAQPLLFFRGQTQSLWVEHLSYVSDAARDQLIDLSVRWGRDKHLQRVLFADFDKHTFTAWKPLLLTEGIGEVKTTKG